MPQTCQLGVVVQPVSFENFASQITSKILARIIIPLLSKIISMSSGSVRDRDIAMNIILENELTYNINQGKTEEKHYKYLIWLKPLIG